MTDAARTADSCRLALPSEAERIASIQRRSWSQLFPAEVADHVLASVDLATMTQSWHAAITRPPLATMRVLVAVADRTVVGFAVVGPSDDSDANPAEDALVGEFVVDPVHQRQGHGSRLLNAVADTLRADGFTRATRWVPSTDDVLRRFLESAGWGADGAHTSVGTQDADAAQLKAVRLHTALA